MEVQFKARGIDQPDKTQARERVWSALGRFSNAIDSVRVSVSDINGPRGGVDTRCVVRVLGKAGWSAVVVDTSEDWPAAVGNSLARVRRSVARRLDRGESGRGVARNARGGP